MAIAQLAFSCVFLMMRVPLRVPFASLWRLWLAGIFLQGLPFLLLFWGERQIAPALACIINSSVGAWALLFSLIVFKDRTQLSATKVLGLFFGLFGVLILCWPDLLHSQDHNQLWGILAVTGMAMSYAFGGLLNQYLNQGCHKVPFKTSVWQQHWGSLIFLFLIALMHPAMLLDCTGFASVKLWIALLYLGIFSTAIAWLIYIHLINHWGTVRASSVLFLTPILALIWDRVFLGLHPTLFELGGVIVILVGMGFMRLQTQACRKR